jgi:hypothetical protein
VGWGISLWRGLFYYVRKTVNLHDPNGVLTYDPNVWISARITDVKLSSHYKLNSDDLNI